MMERASISDDIFRWNDGFRIGLREIDEQHGKLVELLNRLAHNHTSKIPDADLLRVFDELVAYAAYHFATEDRVMRDAGVSEFHAREHRQAHAEFVAKATAARREAAGDARAVTGDVLAFLTNWLIHHILGIDRRLGEEVRLAQQRDGVPQTVEAIPDAERTTEVLLQAVDGLYERLGRNTADLRETNRLLQEELVRSRRAAEDLRVAATAFDAQETIIITDADVRILRVNHAFTMTTGYRAEEVVGRNPRLLSSGRQDSAFYEEMWGAIRATGTWQGEVWNRRKNGEAYPSWLSITAVLGDDGNPTHYVGTSTDIAPRKLAEDRIRNLAYFDQLTQLPNRRLMLDRIEQALTACVRHARVGALLLIDLDDFKSLNDSMGHGVGDGLLVEAARRLRGCVRDGDTVARLGGDEFAVIINDLGAGDQAAMQAELVAAKIQTAIGESYELDIVVDGVVTGGITHNTTASIGIAMFHDRAVSSDDLLTRAETAMYGAKKSGRQAHRFFDPDMQELVRRRTLLEHDLRRAIAERQFELYYQPQVNEAGCVIGAEALVRWRHPERGMIEPAEFIPLAEETGLVVPLGHWVLEESCKQLAAWAEHPETAKLTLAANVSARHFGRGDFVEEVLALVDAYKVGPDRLKIELTESHFLNNPQEVIVRMAQLKARRVGFSMDDFGTGYSSLSYLKQLPLDQLKIDQSFIRDILIHANDAAIAKTIVALAQSLGLSVIAEGVETEGQRNFLLQHGCPTCQGYLFSRPVPLREFEAFAERSRCAS